MRNTEKENTKEFEEEILPDVQLQVMEQVVKVGSQACSHFN